MSTIFRVYWNYNLGSGDLNRMFTYIISIKYLTEFEEVLIDLQGQLN